MSTNLNPTCPTNCVFVLPVNTFDFCRSDIHTGEIEILYMAAPDAECFTDVSNLAEWTTRLSATSLDPDAIRRFRVIGNMPAGTSSPVPISLGQTYYPEKERTMSIMLEDNSQENYDFMRYLECQFTVKIWAQTAGGDLFGGDCGIDVNIEPAYTIEDGQGSIHKQVWNITWKSKFSPNREVSPLA